MYSYVPSYENDLLLLQWLERMRHDNELGAFASSLHIPSSFLTYFRDRAKLIIEVDDDGIWLAAWFEPVMSGAFVGLWIAPNKRRSPSSLVIIDRLIEKALTVWPTLMSITSSSALVEQYRAFGWEFGCEIPKLFDGEDITLLYMTKEIFDVNRRRKVESTTGNA